VYRGLLAEPEGEAHEGPGAEHGGGARPSGADHQRQQDHGGGGAVGEHGVAGVGSGGERATRRPAIQAARGERPTRRARAAARGAARAAKASHAWRSSSSMDHGGGAEGEGHPGREVRGEHEEGTAEQEAADAAGEGLLDVVEAVPIERRARPDRERGGHGGGPEREVPGVRGG
jgi:hypothetical protein